MRYKATIAYDGSSFGGMQTNPQVATVQDELERVLKIIAGRPIKITAAGRTDAGVHARGQVVHFDVELAIAPAALQEALNNLLLPAVRIEALVPVAANFHARYDARRKTYRYRVSFLPPDPFTVRYVWHYKYPVDVRKVAEIIEIFVGKHDFAGFAKKTAVKTTVRTLYTAEAQATETGIEFTFTGDGFLYNQIRMIVAMALEYGQGRIAKAPLIEALATGRRNFAIKVAPAAGLCLEKIEY